MAQSPISVRPQDIAVGHAAYGLLTRLFALLIEKQVISNAEATQLVVQCIATQDKGGDINKLAGQILGATLRRNEPPAESGDAAPTDEPA